jgi:hypothetical protein
LRTRQRVAGATRLRALFFEIAMEEEVWVLQQ